MIFWIILLLSMWSAIGLYFCLSVTDNFAGIYDRNIIKLKYINIFKYILLIVISGPIVWLSFIGELILILYEKMPFWDILVRWFLS